MENNRYYTPEFNEFVVGFEFESNFWYFTKEDYKWTKAIITEDNIEDFKSLYVGDAYPTEFRKLKSMEDLTEEQMENMSLDELQEVIETMNKGKQIDNQEFENFQVLLEKDINITSDVNYKES